MNDAPEAPNPTTPQSSDSAPAETAPEVPPETPAQKFTEAIDAFLTDIECIKEMYQTVVPILEAQDEARMEVAKKVTDEFERKKEAGEPLVLPPDHLKALVINIKKLERAQTHFQQHTLVSIISRYDEFLTAVLKTVLFSNPKWISSDKKISYREVVELQSLETVIKEIIEKEVDQLMHGSHEEQIAFLDEKLKLGIVETFPHWKLFIEATERRNLFVHTGGKVSSYYLEKCAASGVNIKGIKEGDQLSVSEDYFLEAFRCIYLLGLHIGQAAFRRLFPDKLAEADRVLNMIGYGLLEAEEWRLATLVFEFASAIPKKLIGDPEFSLIFLVNLCIAKKQLSLPFRDILARENWGLYQTKYKLAELVLLDDFESAAKLMTTGAIKEAVKKADFCNWPLFRDFRSTEGFRNAFRDAFGEDYTTDLSGEIEHSIAKAQSAVTKDGAAVPVASEPPGGTTRAADGPADGSAALVDPETAPGGASDGK